MSAPLNLYIATLFLLLMGKVCTAQEIPFTSLTEENVFDRQPVLSIAQDRQGRLWFAGENGLYSYDSQQVINLVHRDSSIKDLGYIKKIAINQYDHLFIATHNALYIYDIKKLKILETNDRPFAVNMLVLDIRVIDGQTFLCTEDGLYEAKFEKNSYDLKLLLPRKHLQTMISISNNQFALASQTGIEIVSLTKGRVTNIQNIHIPVNQISNFAFPDLYFEKKDLWVATKFNGLFHYDIRRTKWTNFNESNSNLLSNNVRKVIRDLEGRLLIGTLKGLSVKQQGSVFKNYKHDARKPYTISQNSIYDIFIDQQQIIWVGTYFGGLNAIYPQLIQLDTYSTRTDNPFRLNSDIVSSIDESADFYWIATEEDGLTKMEKTTGLTTALPNLTTSNLIKDLYVRQNKVYIAQYAGGYSVFDIQTNKTKNYRLHDDPHHLKNNIYSIYIDPKETIYLGTNEGLYRAAPNYEQAQVVPEIANRIVTDIQEDLQQTIYVLTNSRIYKKQATENEFQIEQLNDLSIRGFYIDANNNLWVTTSEDIYKKSRSGSLLHIAHFKGNNLGWPIYVNNKLWITSRNGLVFYDPSDGYHTILSQQDGLPLKNMQSAKLFLSEDNNLFITTLNGLVSFNPDSIKFNKRVPSVILRDIAINDINLPFERLGSDDHDNSFLLNLAYNENFLTLNFSSSNFIKPEKNQFKYKLKGFDKDWTESNISTIRYTNIPEGNYTLLIYASNNDMVWSKTPLRISIRIHPPFWNTWWAYIFYAVAFASGIHFIIKFIVEREILINTKKEHDKKIKFFTQISHEIRTPLALITAPLDEVIEETADQSLTQQKVKRIKKNANKLLTIVNELLDFKKFDDNKVLLKKSAVYLREYLEDNFYLLSDLARSKNINYYIGQTNTVGILELDIQQFDKVVFNLLANAIKYTPEKGTVYLELLDKGNYIDIRIVDNGVGISEKNLFKIFEEYYREEQAEDVVGTGLGLALTKSIVELHSGTIRCTTETLHDQDWTVFTISLKKERAISEISVEDLKTQKISPLPLSKQVAQHNETLLIVDDNLELLNYLSGIFQNQYQIIIAQDGEEGLQKAKHYLPDLIISDIMMPRISGSEFCRLIKTNITTSHIPFILLTAVTDPVIQTETLNYGANIYITKPFDSKDLLLSVSNLLQICKVNRKEFLVSTANTKNEIDKQFITAFDQLIEQHLTSEDFDVNFIAKKMGMSAPILYRKLKSITDLSVNNYIKTYRLTKAKQLLQTTLNVSEVAWAVGFSDRKYFSREFKKQFGMNPSEFVTNEKIKD